MDWYFDFDYYKYYYYYYKSYYFDSGLNKHLLDTFYSIYLRHFEHYVDYFVEVVG